MIIIGTVVTMALFLLVGWAVSTEMFQHRNWRRRVESGDTAIVAALIEEALASWRRARPPKEMPAHIWAGIQGLQLVAVTDDSATVSAAAEAEFRTEDGRRVQVSSALDEAFAVAARAIDMMLYDVPNLRLRTVRVDVYTTFSGIDGSPVQQPILSSTATRAVGDSLSWELLDPHEVLARFQTRFNLSPAGQALPIDLPPVPGTLSAPADGGSANLGVAS